VNVPLDAHACRKVCDTPPQAALRWKERAKSMRRAFVCEADFTGKHVAVVGNVMTTGATLNEIARKLQQAGAKRVTGLVAARTLPGAHHARAQDV
jgi:predicted amidophosphoribosyltransferase